MERIVHASVTGYRKSACGKNVDLDTEDRVKLLWEMGEIE